VSVTVRRRPKLGRVRVVAIGAGPIEADSHSAIAAMVCVWSLLAVLVFLAVHVYLLVDLNSKNVKNKKKLMLSVIFLLHITHNTAAVSIDPSLLSSTLRAS